MLERFKLSTSIYNISAYDSAANYIKNDIVQSANKFYYALKDNNNPPGHSLPATNENQYFWGYRSDPGNGELKPYLYLSPSYSTSVDSQPLVTVTSFSEGYQQRSKIFINNNLLTLNISFDNRDINEITCLCHFLATRESVESFLFNAPPPFLAIKRFVCKSWKTTLNFYNNYGLSAVFNETAN